MNMINATLKKFPSIKYIYPHQGSKLIIDFLEKKLPKYIIQNNVVIRGNTVSATIPILLKDKELEGIGNNPVILVGFGVGLQSHLIVLRGIDA